jgi:hypothetical protein
MCKTPETDANSSENRQEIISCLYSGKVSVKGQGEKAAGKRLRLIFLTGLV